MDTIYTVIGGIILTLMALIVAYFLGTIIAVLSSPIFLYLGLAPLKASICTNGILLFWVFRALWKN